MNTVVMALLVALVVTSCKVDSTVTIAVSEDGSGTVEVVVDADAEAAKQIGDPATSLRLADLTEAGWTVAKPRIDAKSGELHLKAIRPFRSTEELKAIVADIGTGTTAPFISDLRLTVKDSFGRTDYRLTGRLKTDGGVASLSDPALAEELGGLPVGRTPEEMAAMGWDGKGVGTLRLRVQLPGGVDEHNGTVVDGQVEWSAPVGSDDVTDKRMVIESESIQRRVQLARVLGFAGIGAAIALVVVGLIRRSR